MKSHVLAAAAAVFVIAGADAAKTPDFAADEAAIRHVLEDSCDGFKKLDLERMIRPYRQDAHIFDLSPPQDRSYAQLRAQQAEMIKAIDGPPDCSYRDMHIKVYGDVAYARYILPFRARLKNGGLIDVEGRGTDIFERADGKWRAVHEHFSLPVNLETGRAEFKPGLSQQGVRRE